MASTRTPTHLSCGSRAFGPVAKAFPARPRRFPRLGKTPKLHFLDSGLLGTLLGTTAERVARDRSTFGTLLETFVFSEVSKQVSWFDENCSLCHYRDKDQGEVDLVIENGIGALVGIEVKASATVNVDNFKGLRKLSSAGGDDFELGLVLYDGERRSPSASVWSLRRYLLYGPDTRYAFEQSPWLGTAIRGLHSPREVME